MRPVPAAVAVLFLGTASPVFAQSNAWRWTTEVGFATAYDSNVNHRADGAASFVGIGSGGVSLTRRQGALRLDAAYSASLHRYDAIPQKDRTSHDTRATLALALGRRATLAATGEISIGGLSEDREVGSEYTLAPRLDLNLDDRNRVRLHTGYRRRAYGELSGRDAGNVLAGIDYRVGAATGARLEIGTRWDANRSGDTRSRFRRWTHRLRFHAPIGQSVAFAVGARQTTRTYPERFIELEPLAELVLSDAERAALAAYTEDTGPGRHARVGDYPPELFEKWRELPRRDEVWAPQAELTIAATRTLQIELGYEFEARLSNDLRRGYDGHRTTLATRIRF